MIKAADMMIARRADTRARADFATWKMMAKLNGASVAARRGPDLPGELSEAAQGDDGGARRRDATINLIYRSYYAEMGGIGDAPDVQAHPSDPVTDNVTAFKRPPPQRSRNRGRSERKTAASRGADLCLPRRGLCRLSIFLALSATGNDKRRERGCAAFSLAPPLTRKITGKVKFNPSSATSGGGCGTGSDRRTIARAASSKAASPDPLTMLVEST